jgi:thioredoxin-related protein
MKYVLIGITAIAVLAAFTWSSDSKPEEVKDNTVLEWTTDFEQAQATAQAEGKYLLINFTGSNWCGWCKRLDREVFTKPEFIEFANENLVCVKLDYPRGIPQPQEEKIQNQKLLSQYRVRGFPTILLTQADGRVALRTGYRPGGAPGYVAHLETKMNI